MTIPDELSRPINLLRAQVMRDQNQLLWSGRTTRPVCHTHQAEAQHRADRSNGPSPRSGLAHHPGTRVLTANAPLAEQAPPRSPWRPGRLRCPHPHASRRQNAIVLSTNAVRRRHRPWMAVVLALVVTMCATVWLAPATPADAATQVQDAVASLRHATSCPPLRYNSVVKQAAEVINRLDDDYASHLARQEPVADPLPGLKDLGYSGKKAVLLRGSATNDADAITVMLLEGYAAIPDCSYQDFGSSVRRNETLGYTFTSLILAGT